MKTQSGIRRAVAAAFLAGSFALHGAWAGPISETAQSLELTGTEDSVTGTLSSTIAAGAPVIVKFWANPTDVVTIDVDTFGYRMPEFEMLELDTIASFHAPADFESPYKVILVKGDSDQFPFDEGSTSPNDPLLMNMVPLSSGEHYAVVTIDPERVFDGDVLLGSAFGSGPVTINVTCVRGSMEASAPPACGKIVTGGTDTPSTPPADTTTETTPEETTTPPATEVKFVSIDVRPNARNLVRLNPKWKAVIPVAILSGQGFNVRDVKAESLTFGQSGDEKSLRNCNKHYTKMHHSRGRNRHTLVCYFENSQAGFEVGDEVGILRGVLKDGTPIEGRANLKVLPEKRHHGHRHGKGHEKHADGDDRRHRGHR